MKILELSNNIETVIQCDCGCKFSFEASDVKLEKIYAIGHEFIETVVYCPLCDHRHIVWLSKRDQQPEGDE